MKKSCAVLLAAAVMLAACQTTSGGGTPGVADDTLAVTDNQLAEAGPNPFVDGVKNVGLFILAVPLIALSVVIGDPFLLSWIVDEID